jgi:hypothetical protein
MSESGGLDFQFKPNINLYFSKIIRFIFPQMVLTLKSSMTSSQPCNARKQKNTNRRKSCKSFPAARGEAKKQNLLLQMMTQINSNKYW